VPDPVDIRLRVARGRRLVISLGETVTMPAATAAARALRVALQPDLIVIASPSRAGRGPTLTVLQLVTDSEAATVRPALENLVAEFRQVAGALVDQMGAGASPVSSVDWDCPETVQCRDATWYLDPHGEHCRFEDPVSGDVVEANIDAPDTVDPYFLLLFAETSGRHTAVRASGKPSQEGSPEKIHPTCKIECIDLPPSERATWSPSVTVSGGRKSPARGVHAWTSSVADVSAAVLSVPR
jgi:hypothetical protein